MATLDEQIDTLLLKQLELYDEYRAIHEQLSSNMKRGFLNMSKARYSLGSTVMSPTSFDLRMKATKKFTLNEQNKLETYVEEKTEDKSTEKLRNRKTPSHTQENADNGPKEFSEPPKPIVDPLYWFGGLPSLSLRNSQREFKNVLDLLPELANITMRMSETETLLAKLQNKLDTTT